MQTQPDLHGYRGFALGLFCGVAMGATASLLLAPKPGVELRHQLSDASSRARHGATDGYRRASSSVTRLADRGRGIVAKGRQAIDRARKQASPQRSDSPETPSNLPA